MTDRKFSDTLRNWRERLEGLPPDQRETATAMLLKLLRARAGAKRSPSVPANRR
jgi:hypothetical protein